MECYIWYGDAIQVRVSVYNKCRKCEVIRIRMRNLPLGYVPALYKKLDIFRIHGLYCVSINVHRDYTCVYFKKEERARCDDSSV